MDDDKYGLNKSYWGVDFPIVFDDRQESVLHPTSNAFNLKLNEIGYLQSTPLIDDLRLLPFSALIWSQVGRCQVDELGRILPFDDFMRHCLAFLQWHKCLDKEEGS